MNDWILALTALRANTGQAIILAVAITGLAVHLVPNRFFKHQGWIVLALLLLLCLPLFSFGPNRLPCIAVLSGILGEISTLSLLLIFVGMLSGSSALQPRVLVASLLSALALYGSLFTYAFSTDLYRLGYLHNSDSYTALWLLGPLALLSLAMPIPWTACVALACLSWALGLQNSTNLWDYLLDAPSVVVYFILLLKAWRARKR